MVPIIILVVTLLTFVVGGILFFINRRRLMFPDGDRVTHLDGGFKVHIVSTTRIDRMELLKEACIRAAQVTETAWKSGGREIDKSIREFVVCIKSDEDFESFMPELTEKMGAYIAICSRRSGAGVPMPVIREKYITEIIENGEPVIHELCHALMGEWHAVGEVHEEKDIWRNYGKDTIQAEADRLFRN